jgi:hypothetical protein
MNILQNMETELQALFLNLALAGSRWSIHTVAILSLGEEKPVPTGQEGGWVNTRAGPDITAKIKYLPMPGMKPQLTSLQPVTLMREWTRAGHKIWIATLMV